jgi:hypothetical protein
MRLVHAVACAFAVAVWPSAAETQRESGRVDADVPFRVGEVLTYDVTFASLLPVGTATSTVRSRLSSTSSSAYDISVEGRPLPAFASLYNVLYRMDTQLDTVTLLPLRTTIYSEENNEKRLGVTTFDRSRFKASFEGTNPQVTTELDIPPQAQDGLSAVYLVRTMTVRPGDAFSLSVVDGGRLYTVGVEIGQPETITVPLGEVEALPAKVTITGTDAAPALSNAAAWISNDRRRLPLRLQTDLAVGNITLLLRQVMP